jgi:hypothetical protein
VILVLVLGRPSAADTHAWFASPGRASWPCAMTERWPDPDREPHYLRFHYGATARCKVPVSLAAEGIIGCPERITAPHRGRSYDIWRFAYDRSGRVTAIEHPIHATTVDWSGGEPRDDDEFQRDIRDGVIEWKLGGSIASSLEVDARSRPLRSTSYDPLAKRATPEGRSIFEWKGDRLIRIQHVGETGAPTYSLELIYDCKRLPKEPPRANAGKDVGIPP